MVYIQSDSERKLPHHFDAACGLYGALDNGQDIRLTSMEEVESGKFDSLIRSNLFIGSVEFMNLVFSRIGKMVSGMIPPREHEKCLISDVLDRVKSGEKLFIKPVSTKLFTGMVFDSMSISMLDKIDSNVEVWVCSPFNKKILSEWRNYVRSGKIIDSRNYSGDFRIAPNWDWVDKQINNLKGFPSCYTIDVGILEDNSMVVIEYNDMWAIGNYGMDNSDYYRMLRERYFEIIRYN
jgi:hypothetical protein